MPELLPFKKRIIPGLVTGAWLVTFLICIAPFDASDLSFKIRVTIMVVYGAIFLLCYLLLLTIEHLLVRASRSYWSNEAIVYLLLYVMVFIPTVLYYESDIVNGDYGAYRFLTEQYLPILLIITPVLFGSRRMLLAKPASTDLVIRGENKLDVLRLTRDQLLYIRSSDNYVEVSFKENGTPRTKLLRTTLSKVEKQFDFLVRVHRSYLINPEHFTDWASKDRILVGGAEVPVTKPHRANLPG